MSIYFRFILIIIQKASLIYKIELQIYILQNIMVQREN